MKKKIQRFFTLTRQEAGFTLVELIVVIAILAILAGIGVPAYSGYITKTNMAADETLAGEVRHALELAYYSNFSDPITGYVILSNTTAPDYGNDEDVKAALEAVFGENLDALTLKYDGWDPSFLTTALSSANPASVGSSSYLTNSTVTDLLDNVQTVTSAAAGLLGTVAKTPTAYMSALEMTLGTQYMEDAVTAGIMTKDASGKYSLVGATEESGNIVVSDEVQTQLSNLMVLSVAGELKNADRATMQQLMLSGLADDADIPDGYTPASAMAARYAIYKAYALDNPDAADDFEVMNNGLASAEDKDDVETALDTFFTTQSAELDKYLLDAEAGAVTDAFNTNADAISAIMNGVNSVSSNYLDASTLKNDTMYTSGNVVDDVNAYISASAAAANLSNLTAEEKAALTTALSGVSSGIVVTVGQNGAVVLKAGN